MVYLGRITLYLIMTMNSREQIKILLWKTLLIIFWKEISFYPLLLHRCDGQSNSKVQETYLLWLYGQRQCKKNGTRDYWGLISFQDYLRLATKIV